jgi:hypothetical protein
MGFEKFHIFAQNAKVLAYGFTENCQFGAKTDRNSVFLVVTAVLRIGYL